MIISQSLLERLVRDTSVRVLLCLILWIALTPAGYPAPAEQYPLTRDALKKRYTEEVSAHRNYAAYATQACSEGYPNIAHLFKALSESEAIHAQNFKTLLTGLGGSAGRTTPVAENATGNTRHNLRRAAGVERDEIDREYPGILEGIQSENHAAAIKNITYAWQAEKQHRELIIRIQKAAGRWFGLLVKRIEGGPSHYHVCNTCGSTLVELPAQQCPICGQPPSEYREIPAFTAAACPLPPKPATDDKEDLFDAADWH